MHWLNIYIWSIVLLLRGRVDMVVIAMTAYSTLHQSSRTGVPLTDGLVSNPGHTLSMGCLTPPTYTSRDKIGVFYSPSRLGCLLVLFPICPVPRYRRYNDPNKLLLKKQPKLIKDEITYSERQSFIYKIKRNMFAYLWEGRLKYCAFLKNTQTVCFVFEEISCYFSYLGENGIFRVTWP